MVLRYPHAQWRPLGPQTQPKMRAHDIICLHTMVGTLRGTDSFFKSNGYGGTESHFGVGGDGTAYQWQDLDYSADANYRGSNHIISIETEDIGPLFPRWNVNDGKAVPAWTTEQIARLADIVAWCCAMFDIPCELIPDSKPGRRGIGYHRQGVPGYMVPGGEQWSTAQGKVCPGDKRIAQIPQVVALARKLLGRPNPVAPETPEGDNEMTIPFYFFDDAGLPDPGGLNFRASFPTEAGQNSAVVDRAWVRWVAYWDEAKQTQWRVVAWDAKRPVGEAQDPNHRDFWELPKNARGFTVEGRRPHHGVIPSAMLLTKYK